MAAKKKLSPSLGRAGSAPHLTSAEVAAEMSDRAPFAFDTRESEERAEAMIAQAEKEIARRKTTVNFRWEVAPLEMVRLAADLAGIPYQTWIKHVLYEQAIATITAAREVDVRARKFSDVAT